ncbi:hypothetical protein C8F04DRAFT_1179564 [Mycena alexandri]|uniref:Uncharacterized protein n=1 Tax=Mycena alexandri TaxID=1745969 RepID=A0AAD6T489_9AGAR|nr:hypothetical protein C8F04DRAFT_1179564 [Mycena alexandri]
MSRPRQARAADNKVLDSFNLQRGMSPELSAARPVLRRTHLELLAAESSTQQKMAMATLSKKERAAVQTANAKAEIRRAKARERMAKRRAHIKVLPPDEQAEFQDKARRARAKYREENRRYLAIASWGYRKRKYIDLAEAVADRTPYDEYLLKLTIRHHKKVRTARSRAAESDLPDSSEMSSSESEKSE